MPLDNWFRDNNIKIDSQESMIMINANILTV